MVYYYFEEYTTLQHKVNVIITVWVNLAFRIKLGTINKLYTQKLLF